MKNKTNGKSSLSGLVQQAIDGNVESENTLAQLFLEQALTVLPHKASGSIPAEDQEDIAISAVKSFCIGIRKGRYQYLGDKQLYSLLYKIIDGKIRKLWQYHFAMKRDIKMSESLDAAYPDSDSMNLKKTNVPATEVQSEYPSEPLAQIDVTPDEQPAVDRILDDLQIELRGLFSVLLNELDEHPRRLLLTMLEKDADNVELANIIGRSVASVERYRKLIRKKIELFGTDHVE